VSDSLSLDALKAKADALAEEINAVDPRLTLLYVPHRQGQLTQTLQMMSDLINEHPAGELVLRILKRTYPPAEPSGFQGLAITMISPWMALEHEFALLGLITLNVDSYKTFDDCLLDLYRLTWNAIETTDMAMRHKHDVGPKGRLLAQRHNLITESRSNMCGDIFATLMMYTEGYEDIVQKLSRHRARESVLRNPFLKPEANPFVLVADAVQFAVTNTVQDMDAETPRIEMAKLITEEISDMCTDSQIQQWWRFCHPAQDMLWRGINPDVIIGAALTTSEDPFVRSIAHQVIMCTNIKPEDLSNRPFFYNSYLDIERNHATHLTMIERAFENLLLQSVTEKSSEPLFHAADIQNISLLDGNFMGWCASALQQAGKGFDIALNVGRPAGQAAKLEFEGTRAEVSMDALRALSNEVCKRKKQGTKVSLNSLMDICARQANLKTVALSIQDTVKHIAYRQSIERQAQAGLSPENGHTEEQFDESSAWMTPLTQESTMYDLMKVDTGLALDEE
jgi:hypothetical protein